MSKNFGQWVITLVVVGVLVGFVLLVSNHKPDHSPSKECLDVRRVVSANLSVGDTEDKLKAFFSKRGWNSNYEELLEGYDFLLEVGGGGIGQKHFIAIHIRIAAGKVTEIKVDDFYRTL